MKYTNGDNALAKSEPKPVWMSDAESASASQQVLATPMALGKVVWRRKWLVVACLTLAVVVAWLQVRRATPLYTSTASVLVEKSMPRLIGAPLASPESDLNQQCSLIVSTTVLNAAVDGLDLATLKTFSGPNAAGDPVAYLRGNLMVEVGKKDNLIYLSIATPDPKDSATLINRVLDAYSAYVGAKSMNTAAEVLKVLTRERDRAEKEWDTTTNAMVDFKRGHGNLSMSTSNGNIVVQRLAKLSDELTDAEIELTEAQSAAGGSNSMLAARNRVVMATGRVATLRKSFEEQQKLAMTLNQDEAEFLKLQTKHAAVERHLSGLTNRIKEIDLARDAGDDTVKVVEWAVPSSGPSSPQKVRIMVGAMFIGLIAGLGLAWVREWTDARLHSTDEIVTTLGMPVLGMIPHMSGRQSTAIRGRKVQLEFMSDVAEAYRTLRTSIYFGTRNEPAKTLLVTSPTQGDGKSTTASNLAIAMAQAGRRTLIVDTDFRRPQLHKIFEIKDEVGLSSVLAGRETLDRAIHTTGVKGLEILPCGPIPSNPSEILNSDAFAKLLMSLGTRYDMIVLDSPPVAPVTDARILGAICDATLLVLKSDKSTRKSATMSADALHGVGARVLGIVCNGVSRKTGTERYYTGYGYGYPRSGMRPPGGPDASRRLPMAQMSE